MVAVMASRRGPGGDILVGFKADDTLGAGRGGQHCDGEYRRNQSGSDCGGGDMAKHVAEIRCGTRRTRPHRSLCRAGASRHP
jgi:hypothetical protein